MGGEMGKMDKVVMEFELIYPYSISMGVLVDFCHVWQCHILSGGTKKMKAKISMPSRHFERIFKIRPQVGHCQLPSGMGGFVDKITVTEV